MEIAIIVALLLLLIAGVIIGIKYIRSLWKIINGYRYFYRNVQGLLKQYNDRVSEFGKHLADVYSMEKFYADPTLDELLSHMKLFHKVSNKFSDQFKEELASIDGDVVDFQDIEEEEQEEQETVKDNEG